MMSHKLLNNLPRYSSILNNISRYSKSAINIETIEKDSAISSVYDEEAIEREQQLQKKRDKSRLTVAHKNLINGTKPYDEPRHWAHGTLRYNRAMYGQYGEASGVNPVYCWPTKAELKDTKEHEQIKYLLTIPQMIENCKRVRKEKQEAIHKRQMDIVEKMKKLDGWMKELEAKIAKKEADARIAKERKDKLIEEVRRHFGYTVDPRDVRFKEMLEKKEKEQKKQMKEAKKKMKEAKVIEKLLAEKGGNKEARKVE